MHKCSLRHAGRARIFGMCRHHELLIGDDIQRVTGPSEICSAWKSSEPKPEPYSEPIRNVIKDVETWNQKPSRHLLTSVRRSVLVRPSFTLSSTTNSSCSEQATPMARRTTRRRRS